MIVLLGASGYVGKAFVEHLTQQKLPHVVASRSIVDYYNVESLSNFLKQSNAQFLINCAGYTGKPNVDACEKDRTECLNANAVLPGRIAAACQAANIPWGHVSSGCIFTGQPAEGKGFTEMDPPNFSFRQNNCSFYSGCKALGEECLTDAAQCYIWRLRIPFDHVDSSRNYISKVLRYARLLDARNSLSHLGEFVQACCDCWLNRVEFGIYNLTNTGSVTTRELTELLTEHGLAQRAFDFFGSEEEFMKVAAKTPRSNTVLDNSKALAAGLRLSPVQDVLVRSIQNWIWES